MNDKQLATLEEQKENWERTAINSWSCWTPTLFAARSPGSLHWCAAGSQRWAYSPAKPAIGEADAIRLNGGRVHELSA